MRITLRVTAGIFKGKEFTFTGHDTFLVGRSKHTHFRLPSKDRTCSRIHFMLEVNPPHCRLMDMGSNNGTYVNDARVSVVELKDGDKIRAGANILRVAVGQSEGTPPAPESIAAMELPTISVPLPPPSPPPPVVVSPPPPKPEAPTVGPSTAPFGPPIPGYRILSKIGEGGMGVVYLAQRLEDQCQVALKTIRPAVAPDPRDVERFLREARILRDLQHGNIVGFRDLGESDGCLYFAMDYVDGPNTHSLVAREGPLPIGRAVALACQLLDALAYAHGRRFVHRDIKPSNVLVTTINGQETVKLADFGLARVYQASKCSGLTMSGDVGGTPAYMAPEQLVNFRESPASVDQYAAAATLYYLLTAGHVFDLPKQMHLLYRMILNDDPVPIRQRRPDVPAGLATVIHRALMREPTERFASVAEMRPALETYRGK